MKINGRTEKYVWREAAKSVITDEVYRRQDSFGDEDAVALALVAIVEV